jgi:hypothetical protein
MYNIDTHRIYLSIYLFIHALSFLLFIYDNCNKAVVKCAVEIANLIAGFILVYANPIIRKNCCECQTVEFILYLSTCRSHVCLFKFQKYCNRGSTCNEFCPFFLYSVSNSCSGSPIFSLEFSNYISIWI